MTVEPVALSDVHPPEFQSLADIYDESILSCQKARYARLAQEFKSRFGREPEFFARSPGRVNLIGEHIDYAYYSVLPMAVERDVVMAVATEDEASARVLLANTSAEYPEREFQTDPLNGYVHIDAIQLEWSNYFKCGYKGVLETLGLKTPKTMWVMMDGTVPSGSGLSSSSAFVCCSALATVTANGKRMTKGELTQVAIYSERYSGVQAGGMDQSISVMAPRGSPLIIHFYPKLAAEPVHFSNVNPVFVIANTLVTANKHETAPTNYNLRVVETRLAAALLAKQLNLTMSTTVFTLREVQEAFVSQTSLEEKDFCSVLEDLMTHVEQNFKKSLYSRADIAALLNMTIEQMEKEFVGSIVIRAEGFALYKRSLHVLSEARRVLLFMRASEDSSSTLKHLGDLMNASQFSCQNLFDCSCPEIDELTKLSRSFGAFGSRLTGAGWGGCTVSLVDGDQVNGFIDALKQNYYLKKFPSLKTKPHVLDDCIFATKPGTGCGILRAL